MTTQPHPDGELDLDTQACKQFYGSVLEHRQPPGTKIPEEKPAADLRGVGRHHRGTARARARHVHRPAMKATPGQIEALRGHVRSEFDARDRGDKLSVIRLS